MSKSKGNVIDPLDVIDSGYGADTLRTYEMFIGPYNEDAAWSTKGVGGVYRFLNRCWTLCFGGEANVLSSEDPELRRGRARDTRDGGLARRASDKESFAVIAAKTEQIRHKTIKKVTQDLHRASFNTAVAALMEYVNELYKSGASKEDLIILGKLLKPFAPHLASEMLESLKADDVWPTWDESKLAADVVEVVVQVNGKLRAKLSVPVVDTEDEDKVIALALKDTNVQKFVSGKPKKSIYVPRAHLLNLVA